MISYLGIGFYRQAVGNYNIPDLFHLVRFALSGMRLQVEDFGDAIAEEYMVAALDALLEPKPLQKLHHAEKGDICVCAAPQNLVEKFIRSRHIQTGCGSVTQQRHHWQALPDEPDFSQPSAMRLSPRRQATAELA
jgi:hypothetical protein